MLWRSLFATHFAAVFKFRRQACVRDKNLYWGVPGTFAILILAAPVVHLWAAIALGRAIDPYGGTLSNIACSFPMQSILPSCVAAASALFAWRAGRRRTAVVIVIAAAFLLGAWAV